MQPNKKALQLFNNAVTLCWLTQIYVLEKK